MSTAVLFYFSLLIRHTMTAWVYDRGCVVGSVNYCNFFDSVALIVKIANSFGDIQCTIYQKVVVFGFNFVFNSH